MIGKFEAKLLRMLVLDEEFNANSKFKLKSAVDVALPTSREEESDREIVRSASSEEISEET